MISNWSNKPFGFKFKKMLKLKPIHRNDSLETRSRYKSTRARFLQQSTARSRYLRTAFNGATTTWQEIINYAGCFSAVETGERERNELPNREEPSTPFRVRRAFKAVSRHESLLATAAWTTAGAFDAIVQPFAVHCRVTVWFCCV